LRLLFETGSAKTDMEGESRHCDMNHLKKPGQNSTAQMHQIKAEKSKSLHILTYSFLYCHIFVYEKLKFADWLQNCATYFKNTKTETSKICQNFYSHYNHVRHQQQIYHFFFSLLIFIRLKSIQSRPVFLLFNQS
jgi:hypothetical protein